MAPSLVEFLELYLSLPSRNEVNFTVFSKSRILPSSDPDPAQAPLGLESELAIFPVLDHPPPPPTRKSIIEQH